MSEDEIVEPEIIEDEESTEEPIIEPDPVEPQGVEDLPHLEEPIVIPEVKAVDLNIPIKEERNSPRTKELIDQALVKLEANVRKKGNGSILIKELRDLSKQTSIKRQINKSLDSIINSIRRKDYTRCYESIASLRGIVKAL